MAGLHAKKGPSGAERLHACPGALPLVGLIPEEKRSGSGPAARLGTSAHFLLEKCLVDSKPPEDFRDRIIELLGDHEDGTMLKVGAKQPTAPRVWFRVDDDMIEGVTYAYDYTNKRIAELGEGTHLLTESKTNPCPDRDDTWGTADVTIDSPFEMLEVVDYKNGYRLVEHLNNPQLLAYLAGRAHDTGWSHGVYRITVIQPNAFHDEGRIRSFEISRVELQRFVEKHRLAAELSDLAADVLHDECKGDPSHELEMGGTWAETYLSAGPHCEGTMCDGRLTCPAYRLYKETVIDEGLDSPVEDELPVDMQAETAAQILLKVPHWDALKKLAKAYEAKLLKEGVTLPGRKVVRAKPRGRVWTSPKAKDAPNALAQEVVKKGYISANEVARLFTEPALITGPKAAALVPSKLRKGFGADFLTMPKGALTTAPLDDPRDAVVISEADFPDDTPEGYDDE